MTRAEFLAKEYLYEYNEKNMVCTNEEVEELVNEYKRINKIGIPATNFILFANCSLKIIIYTIVAIIK